MARGALLQIRSIAAAAGFSAQPAGELAGLLVALVGEHTGRDLADLLTLQRVVALEGAVGVAYQNLGAGVVQRVGVAVGSSSSTTVTDKVVFTCYNAAGDVVGGGQVNLNSTGTGGSNGGGTCCCPLRWG